jgi:hypothetical protein
MIPALRAVQQIPRRDEKARRLCSEQSAFNQTRRNLFIVAGKLQVESWLDDRGATH